jgi:hypothetical protein
MRLLIDQVLNRGNEFALLGLKNKMVEGKKITYCS